MKRAFASIGILVGFIFLLFSSCSTSSFEGEYSLDGRGKPIVTILDNGTAELMINGYGVVDYEKKGSRLEIDQTDVLKNFVHPITSGDFTLTENEDLLLSLYENEELHTELEYIRIPGSNGESGEESVLWLTLKSLFLGFIIFIIMATGVFLFMRWLVNKGNYDDSKY
ncbi:hypothetical protein [Planococcus maritimus]|uniref:hypothetical protein n=1 Tax=Planococcus maritimus TaxID=192421 RepID=UPI00232FAA3C|nr:hypothetical protein [Planococcus maritimus]